MHSISPGCFRRLRRSALTLSRVLLQVLYVGVALLGVLVGPPVTTLVLGFAVGMAGAGLFVVVHWSCHERVPARRTVLGAGTTAAAFVPFAEGIDALGSAGTLLALAIMMLATVVGGHWVATAVLETPAAPAAAATSTGRGTPTSSSDHDTPTSAADDPALGELLRVVPLDALFTEWRATEEDMDTHRGGHRYAAAVHIRRLLLEEMDRRDPDGVERWLRAGARGRPEQHIRGGHDLTA